MSMSANLHGPHIASARLIQAGKFAEHPFVSIDITVPGASVTLIDISADGLESLSAALGNARVLLSACDPPEYDPDEAEAQRIAEVFDEARAELDRGL